MTTSSGLPQPQVVDFAVVPTDDVSPKEKGRTLILWWLFPVFAATVLGAFVAAMWSNNDWSNVKDLLDLILPAETALLGVAVAFYMTD